MKKIPESSTARLLSVFLVVLLWVIAGCSSSTEVPDDVEEVESPADKAKKTHVADIEIEEATEEEAKEVEELSLDERVEEAAHSLESGDDYAVLFSQDGEYIPIDDYRLEIDPHPFEIHVVAAADTWAAVNIREDSQVLDDFLAQRPIPEEVGGPAMGMAERPFNESQHIFIEPEGLNMWGYEDDDNHRFDTVEEVGDVVVGTRTVAELFDVSIREATKLEAAGGMELHFLEFGPSDEEHRREPVRGYTLEISGGEDIKAEETAEETPTYKEEVDRYGKEVPIEKRLEHALAALADDDYAVFFSQRGEYLPITDDRVVVAPEPFEVHVVTGRNISALLNVNTDPAALKAARGEGELPTADHGARTGELGTALPEDPYNPMQRVQLHNVGLNAWGYMQEPEHRFDDLEVRGDHIVGTRTVSQFHDVESDETTLIGDAEGEIFHFVEFNPDDDDRQPRRAYTLEVTDQ